MDQKLNTLTIKSYTYSTKLQQLTVPCMTFSPPQLKFNILR